MAIGDIISISINPTAWQAEIDISGMGTGANYNLGFGPGNSIISPYLPKIIFNVNSSGFNDNGEPISISRTVYGTTGIRKPYPNESQKDEVASNGNIKLKVALSEYIYQKDSNITANILSGYYTSGALISSGATNFSVTNNSNLDYPKVIANWSWPRYERVTSSTYPMRCVAFHKFGQQGRPVRVVKFIANDEHNNFYSGSTLSPTIDSNIGDAVPVIEYIHNIPFTSFYNGDNVTGNFIAYPWIGDTGSILNTNDKLYTFPTVNYAPFRVLNDYSGTYGVTVVVVDPVTGNNNVGQAVDLSSFNLNSPPPAYATINSGALAISVYNNSNRGRNDIGAGIILLKTGNHFWVSGSSSYGATPKTNVIISRYPGVDINSVNISNANGNSSISSLTQISGINLTSSAAITFNNIQNLWFHKCNFDLGGAALVYGNGNWSVTNSICKIISQGLAAYSTQVTPVILNRGNIITGVFNIKFNTAIGNLFTSGNTSDYRFFSKDAGVTQSVVPIFAYNNALGADCNTNYVFGLSPEIPSGHIGSAVVQNVIENTQSASSNLVAIYGDGNTSGVNNILIWHNTFVGQRSNIGYNDTTFYSPEYKNWSVKNNIFDDYNIKSDTFPTASGIRTGNWPSLYGVGFGGNAFGEISGIGAPGVFLNEFNGINNPTGGNINPTGYFNFSNRKSYNGISAQPGLGDYSLTQNSPAILNTIDYLLPYDLSGISRSSNQNAIGAYSYYISISPDGSTITYHYRGQGFSYPLFSTKKFGIYNPSVSVS